MKNNKAFTLVELLAVITILGIILAVAIPKISTLFNSTKSDMLNIQKANVLEAGKAYFLDDSDDVKPYILWETSKVSLQTLIDKGYIDEVKNPQTDEVCDTVNSYVETGKGENNKSIYYIKLVCGTYETSDSNSKFKISEYKIKTATKRYFEVNGGEPTVDGQRVTVLLSDLVSGGYITNADLVSGDVYNSQSIGLIELEGSEYNYYSGFVSDNYISLDGWNQLYDIGEFEIDTDENGIADGWANNGSDSQNLTTFVNRGYHAQEITYSNQTGDAAFPGVVAIEDITEGHTYYASVYFRQFNLKGVPKLILHNLDSSDNLVTQDFYGPTQMETTDEYYKIDLIDTDTTGIAKYRIYYVVRSDAVENINFGCDSAVLLDLTQMGLESKTTEEIDQMIINSGYSVEESSEVQSEPTENTAPTLALVGESEITLYQGYTYTDAGAIATDAEDGNLTSSILVSNPVDINTVGTYTVTYNVEDLDNLAATPITRTVIVETNNAPVLALSGTDNIATIKGETYTDAGATASDTEEGDITSDIVTVNPVNINIPGVYTITYNVTDPGNFSATEITRTVTVVEEPQIALIEHVGGASNRNPFSYTITQNSTYFKVAGLPSGYDSDFWAVLQLEENYIDYYDIAKAEMDIDPDSTRYPTDTSAVSINVNTQKCDINDSAHFANPGIPACLVSLSGTAFTNMSRHTINITLAGSTIENGGQWYIYVQDRWAAYAMGFSMYGIKLYNSNNELVGEFVPANTVFTSTSGYEDRGYWTYTQY